MIKVMIIEDEPQINKLLAKIVEREEGFEVAAQAESFSEALTLFSKCRPEVAFVDVDLKGESGMDCAKLMLELDPKLKVIFATAHNEYMAGAFEIYAFDYIVKPFDVDRVRRSLRRIRAEEEEKELVVNENHKTKETDCERLLIRGKERIDFVDINDIIFIERTDSSTNIVTETEVFKSSASLSELEQRLGGPSFMRSHKSYIINISKITKIEPYGRWTFSVKFKGIKDSALVTSEKYNELKATYGI